MFLKHLYSEPYDLFEQVNFKEGVNFIFGKKEGENSRDSLNGIGKSTTLELIDFCLCADFNSKSSPRLFKEAKRIKDYYIVLEFEVGGTDYIIRRSAGESKKIEFGETYAPKDYEIKEARKELFNTIFRDESYEGVQKESWYRSLISFYLKVHKRSKNEFIDPILYITSLSKLYELNQFHLYFMGIDNSLIYKNSELQNSVKDRDAALREIKRLIESKGVSIIEAQKRLDRLKNEISKASKIIDSFELAKQHKNVEERLNILTNLIKRLSEDNYWDNNRLTTLLESAQCKDILTPSKVNGIERIYAEISKELSIVVKRTLAEAVEFRKNLSRSRENFLREEIEKLNANIDLRDIEIEKLDLERSQLFKSLKAKSAFTDLKEAYLYVGMLQNDYSELESTVETYKSLEASKVKWKSEDSIISVELKDFLVDIKQEVEIFKKIFSYVYDNIYPLNESSGFSITQNFGKSKHKMDINVSFDSEESKGWNKGRTLIYDLAIVLNSIERKLKRPKFLVHDGIFDGMDKAHFVDLIQFVKKEQVLGHRFQYIITLNEEGTLNSNFGVDDELTAEHIAEQAISVLSPKHKLWR